MTGLTQAEQIALTRLGWHWSDDYALSVIDGTWIARPVGSPADLITADSAAELRELLREDYGRRRPVSGHACDRMST